MRSWYIATFLVLGLSSQVGAVGYLTTIGGVTVSYSLPGAAAVLDVPSGFLIVAVTQSGGSLKITASSTAFLAWGDFCPVLIEAPDILFGSIKVNGNAPTGFRMFVVGEIGWAGKFKGNYTDIGGLGADPTVGLYFADNSAYPFSLTLKNGVAWGTFCGTNPNAEPQREPAQAQFAPGPEESEAVTPPVQNPRLRALLDVAREAGGVRRARSR